MPWKVTFYSEKVEEQTLGLPSGILATLLRILELIEEFGPSLGKPHTAALGDGLFEIRAKGKEGIARAMFCTVRGQEVIVLHTFIKKTRKTPRIALDLAKKRMKEVLKQ